MVGGRKELQELRAFGDVKFVDEQWADKPQGVLETRMVLHGPQLLFDHQRQRVNVIGPGRLLIQDERASEKKTANAKTPANSKLIKLTEESTKAAKAPAPAPNQKSTTSTAKSPLMGKMGGRGKTLFIWTGSLKLDGLTGHMRINQGGQMLHQPSGGGDVMQLDFARMLALLATAKDRATQEVESGAGKKADKKVSKKDGNKKTAGASQPMLKAVYAHGSGSDRLRIVVAGQDRIFADHLEYDAKTQLVTLTADEGEFVELFDDQFSRTFRKVLWNLKDGSKEGINPGGGRTLIGGGLGKAPEKKTLKKSSEKTPGKSPKKPAKTKKP